MIAFSYRLDGVYSIPFFYHNSFDYVFHLYLPSFIDLKELWKISLPISFHNKSGFNTDCIQEPIFKTEVALPLLSYGNGSLWKFALISSSHIFN